ncbi:hypothetical protein EA462_08115 [Natrarchaeobius halalkaliphilus]|uniref:Uncharacterized protein n=1 Tax=Natrarchaeobius halalkaliphilus TaxID=1679091 RepID=A0A3N6LLR0_9EURY|nr:hypothetical protein EA462_08115 [Natrarchaeobius halalkaliphilus]
MCDRFGNCSNDGTCQLVLRNRITGMERVEYHCKAHLVLRVWELEDDDAHDVIDATPLNRSSSPTDQPEPGQRVQSTDPSPESIEPASNRFE